MNLKKIFRKLFPERTINDFPGSYIPHHFALDRTNHGPVLIVGDPDGREYLEISKKIEKTYLLDVVDNKIAPKDFFVHTSIESPLPFPDNFFKTILVNDVLEFLWEDKKALENVYRVLAMDGTLIAGVPFYTDLNQYHYHVYTPRTFELLLKHSGFKMVERIYRGLIISTPNTIVSFLALILFPFFGKKALEKVNSFLYRLHIKLGNFRRLNSIFRFGKGRLYGISVVAKKINKEIDSVKEQEIYYSK